MITFADLIDKGIPIAGGLYMIHVSKNKKGDLAL